MNLEVIFENSNIFSRVKLLGALNVTDCNLDLKELLTE